MTLTYFSASLNDADTTKKTLVTFDTITWHPSIKSDTLANWTTIGIMSHDTLAVDDLCLCNLTLLLIDNIWYESYIVEYTIDITMTATVHYWYYNDDYSTQMILQWRLQYTNDNTMTSTVY